LELAKKYNKREPIVHNTYQMYLKESPGKLKSHVELLQKAGALFGVKLVRGAYMDKERQLAKEQRVESPINNTIADTHRAYNDALEYLVSGAKNGSVLIATHNEESVRKAWAIMKKQNLPPSHPHVAFAQLYGMCDHISLTLADHGATVCKYLPFGPVGTVTRYLLRRVQENKSVIGRTAIERYLISREIRRRMGFRA